MMRRLTAICLAVLLGGCLQFDEQTFIFSYNVKADRVTLHIVYYGLSTDGSAGKDAFAPLKEAVEDGDVCLLDWPFHYDPSSFRDSGHPIAQLLLRSVRARPVGFFLDEKGRLSAGQIVTIDNASRLVAAYNEAVSAEIDDALEIGDHKADAETLQLLEKAKKNGHEWLRLHPHRVEFVAPISDAYLATLEKSFEKEMKDDAGMAALVRSNPIGFLREGNLAKITVGIAGKHCRIRLPDLKREYEPMLLDAAKKAYGLQFDAKIAQWLRGAAQAEPPASGRVRALVEQLASDSPAVRAEAMRKLRGLDLEVAMLLPFTGPEHPPEVRRAVHKLIERITERDLEREFARVLDRPERIRILLGGTDEVSNRLLRAELKHVAAADEAAKDPRAFWTAWLKKRQERFGR
ncbi:MAG: hypothetical protein OER88_08015 [Planctomycetota bacterium]|nr:hypothetical protein [Planctomycetota bacterium]